MLSKFLANLTLSSRNCSEILRISDGINIMQTYESWKKGHSTSCYLYLKEKDKMEHLK